MENIDYTEYTSIDLTSFERALAELEKETLRLVRKNAELEEQVIELNGFVDYLIRKYNIE